MKLFWAFAIVAIALMAFAIYLSMFSRMEVEEQMLEDKEQLQQKQDAPAGNAAWPLPVSETA